MRHNIVMSVTNLTRLDYCLFLLKVMTTLPIPKPHAPIIPYTKKFQIFKISQITGRLLVMSYSLRNQWVAML
jgi:hypothetical protein